MPSVQLSSPRLSLLPFTPEDAHAFHQINIDPFVRQFLWDDEIISLALAEDLMLQNEKHFTEDQFGLWKILLKNTDTLIGYTGLWYFFDESQPQLIYALLPAFTGQGYAKEAAEQIVQYTFSQLAFDYLIAATDPPHLASQRLAIKLGMEKIDTKEIEGKTTVFFRLESPDLKAAQKKQSHS